MKTRKFLASDGGPCSRFVGEDASHLKVDSSQRALFGRTMLLLRARVMTIGGSLCPKSDKLIRKQHCA